MLICYILLLPCVYSHKILLLRMNKYVTSDQSLQLVLILRSFLDPEGGINAIIGFSISFGVVSFIYPVRENNNPHPCG